MINKLSNGEVKDIIKEVFVELHCILSLNDTLFCAYLYQYDLLPEGNYEMMNETKGSSSKVYYFMYNVVMRDAKLYLPKLLEVMTAYNDPTLKAVAMKIEARMKSGGIYLMLLHVKIYYNDIL